MQSRQKSSGSRPNVGSVVTSDRCFERATWGHLNTALSCLQRCRVRFGTHTDIQDLKTAESALRQSEAELANVRHVQQTLDSIPVAAWRARADGFVEYLNKRWLDYAGVSLDQVLGWQWAGSFHPEDFPRVNDIWRQLLASGSPGEVAARMRRHDGSYRWFLARAEPSRDDTGRVVAWYGTNTDIEDRTQALARLQEMETDFAHINRV